MCSYALSSTYCLRQSSSRLSYTYVIVKRFFAKIFSAHRSAFVLLHLLCYPVFYASTTAAFIFCTYSFTYATQSAPCSATLLTIADPTIAPSENAANVRGTSFGRMRWKSGCRSAGPLRGPARRGSHALPLAKPC